MIIFLCKFIHYLALFIAGGAGIGNGVIQSIYQKEGKIPEPHLAKAFRVLVKLALISIISIWVTGLIMVYSIYGSFNLGWPFHMKLFGATVLLLGVAYINFHLNNSFKNQQPPNTALLKRIVSINRLSLVLILSGAILAFN